MTARRNGRHEGRTQGDSKAVEWIRCRQMKTPGRERHRMSKIEIKERK